MTARPIEAEQAVLGSILIDSRCLEVVTRMLCPQDFALMINRDLYQAILNMDREGRKIDPVTVLGHVNWGDGYDEGQARNYILQLMDTTPTAANVEEYAEIVRTNALERGARAISSYITEQLDNHVPVQEVLMAVARQSETLQKEGVNEDLMDPDSAMLAFYEHRERVIQGGDAAFVRTGYQDLDNQLGGGMLNGGMYILAARPGMGKTTLAINIADRLAKSGSPVLFVSLEMDPEQIEAKRLARETGIPANRLLMDTLSDDEENSIAHAADVIRALPVHLNKLDSLTVSQVEIMARRVRNLRLIVIDYIGKIIPETHGRSPNRTEYMTEISGAIKNLARRFQIPVLVLCQLNRAVEARSDKRPNLSDLRDTGAIEQDADGVIFLYRPDYYENQDKEISDLRVIVEKNRHGSVGECTLAFDLSASKMTTSRRAPIARRKTEALGPTQLSWEDLDKIFDRKFPFGDRELKEA